MFRNDNRPLFHDHPPRHHGASLFGVALSRLRPALYYFTLAVVITTFFYCLLFYEPDSSRHHPHRRFRGIYGQQSALISSSSGSEDGTSTGARGVHQSAAFLLEEFIRNANLHFVDNYARKIPLVPTLLDHDSITNSTSSSDSQNRQKSGRYDIVPNDSNNTQSDVDNNVRIHLIDEDSNNSDGDDVDLAQEDEDYLELVDDPDSIEHHLEVLGFNIRHITRYLLHMNQSSSAANATTKKITRVVVDATSKLSPSSSTLSAPSSSSSNLSSINDILELLSGASTDSTDGANMLVFVNAINSNQYNMAYRFIKSFERYRQAYSKATTGSSNQSRMHLRLMIYDLGLTEDQLFQIETLCNQTWEQSITSLCKIRKFHFDHYPSHVFDLKIAAYRSIIMQEMLRDIRRARKHIQLQTAVGPTSTTTSTEQIYNLFWLDPHYRFLPNTIESHSLAQLLADTRNISGIRSWPIEAPTSSLTHPRMCDYFHTTADNFYFHRMVRTSHLLLSISESTWQPFELGLMLPWVRCALTEDCIAPLGSQYRSSCRLDKKPHYRYSGCHHYDMSALNVVLGIAYNFSSSEYSAPRSTRFFAPFYKLLKTPDSTKTSSTSSRSFASGSSWVPPAPAAGKSSDDIIFDYVDYDPGQPVRHEELESLLESEDRFDRALTDDDLPEEQRRPVPKRPSSSGITSSLLSASLFHHHQHKSLSSPSSSSLLSSTSPEEEYMHSLKQRKSL